MKESGSSLNTNNTYLYTRDQGIIVLACRMPFTKHDEISRTPAQYDHEWYRYADAQSEPNPAYWGAVCAGTDRSLSPLPPTPACD